MTLHMATTSDRPDLAPVVADWLWREFWRRDGHSFDDTLQAVIRSSTSYPMPRTFILLAEGAPVGTASLAEHDLDTRRDLSPWLAGVFVEPAARGKGYAGHLIEAVVEESRRQAHPAIWLYTRRAESIYAKAGWLTVERFQRRDQPYALMRRSLTET